MAYPSEDQIRTAFRMLNIPYTGPLVLTDGIGLNATVFATYTTTYSVQTLLRSWLLGNVTTFPSGVSGQMDAASGTKASAIIVQYSTLAPARGISGTINVGSIQGIQLNVNEMIDNLIGDLQNLVPFFKDLKDIIEGSPVQKVSSCKVF